MKAMILAMALPLLEAIGLQLKAIDTNDEGNDDLAGAAIIYAADVTRAVNDKKAIPFPPDILLRGGNPAHPVTDATTKPLS